MPDVPVDLIRPQGLTPYEEAHALQLGLVEALRQGRGRDTLVLVEHPPVITLGRNADPAGVLVPGERLRALGIGLHRVERGGQATYHGPGQVVGYPVVRLRRLGLGVRAYVERLEEVLIRTAAAYSVEARRVPGRPGVFCEQGKLAAIGVAVTRGVAYHGFAFNVRPDLAHFRLIVPCGLTDVAPTSLEAVLGRAPPVAEVAGVLAKEFSGVFGVRLVPPTPAPKASEVARPQPPGRRGPGTAARVYGFSTRDS